MIQPHQTARVRIGEGIEHDAVHDREHRDARTDPDAQGRHTGDGEAEVPAQAAQGKRQFGEEWHGTLR